MVCSRCQKIVKQTDLATPAVKRKNEMYLGSPSGDKNKPTATAGNTAIGKNKLLSKSAKNPYAAYASSCETCKRKTERGRKLCQKCAYKANACAMCGKSLTSTSDKAKTAQPVVQGQKFSAK